MGNIDDLVVSLKEICPIKKKVEGALPFRVYFLMRATDRLTVIDADKAIKTLN